MGLLKVRRHLGQPGQVGRRGKRFKYSHGGRNRVGREARQVDGGEVAYTVPACQGGTLHQAAIAVRMELGISMFGATQQMEGRSSPQQ